jgi:hypothetical protein
MMVTLFATHARDTGAAGAAGADAMPLGHVSRGALEEPAAAASGCKRTAQTRECQFRGQPYGDTRRLQDPNPKDTRIKIEIQKYVFNHFDRRDIPFSYLSIFGILTTLGL